MNGPNILTLSRFVLTVFFLKLIGPDDLMSRMLAGGIFLIATFTDWLDGYWARKYHLVSSFGKILDPIADKFLTLGAFVVFALMGVIPVWMSVVIAGREILVTATRFWALSRGRVLAAETMGKYKTVVQMVAIGAIIVFLILVSSGSGGFSFFSYSGWEILIQVLMLATVVLTVGSGLSHYYQNREVYRA